MAAVACPAIATARGKAPNRPHGHGGSLRSAAQGAGFAALLVSGLALWLWPGQSLLLWPHVGGGAALLAALAPWVVRHLPAGLAASRRPGFTQTSLALLALWLALFLSGLAMAAPALLWFAGRVWFPAREVTEALALVHFWAAWPAAGGFVLHLGLRHWPREGA